MPLTDNEDARVVTTLFMIFLRCSRTAYSIMDDGWDIPSKLLQLSLLPAIMEKYMFIQI